MIGLYVYIQQFFCPEFYPELMWLISQQDLTCQGINSLAWFFRSIMEMIKMYVNWNMTMC